MRILSSGIVRARDDSCNNACAGKARSRGTRCRDVIFETLFETLWVTNPIRGIVKVNRLEPGRKAS